MNDFTINEIKVSLPSGWDGVTVDQFLKLKEAALKPDILVQLSILSNTDKQLWFDSDIETIYFETILDSIAWAVTTPDIDNFIMPPVYQLGEKIIVIPKDLTLKTLGQKITFEQMILSKAVMVYDKPACDINVICEAVAIYLQPLYTGEKFDPEKLDEVVSLVRHTLFCDVYAIASFFLTQLFPSAKLKQSNSKETTMVKKKGRALKTSTSLAQ